MNDAKLEESTRVLSQALKAFGQDPGSKILFAAVTKTFEVCLEYAWKSFKRAAHQAGMEVYSPRDAIKAAAQLDLIGDLELWNSFLNARNQSIHDYIGIADADFFPLIKKFENEVKKLTGGKSK